MNFVKILDGRGGLAGVQRALRSRSVRKTLRRELGSMLADPTMLGQCRLRRVKLKPGRKLTAYIDATVRDSNMAWGTTRSVVVTWTLPTEAGWQPPGSEVLAIQAKAREYGSAAPFLHLIADIPAICMRLQVAPLDVSFPQLVRMCSSDYMAGLALSDIYPDTADRELLVSHTVTAIRYRPEQRHVLRYDRRPSQRDNAIFAKLYATSTAGLRASRVAVGLDSWLRSQDACATVVQPLAYVVADSAILYRHVSGTPLSRQLPSPGLDVMRCLRQAGHVLRLIHEAPTGLRDELVPHDFAEELALVMRASEYICVLRPDAGALIEELLHHIHALHRGLPQEPPTFVYGDFKADHLLCTPAGMTLLDIDTCRLADPALDIGKILADLQWWYALYEQPDLELAQTNVLAGYGQDVQRERLIRARLYEALLLIKMTARRVSLLDPRWAVRTERMLHRAEAVLGRVSSLCLPQV